MEHIKKNCCCLQSKEKCIKSKEYRLKSQLAITTVVLLVGLNHGMSISHAAVLIPQIQAENSTLQIDEDEATWIASLYNFASPLGALVGGILTEFFGRRCGVMISLGGMAIGWMMIILSQSSGTIMAGRCLEGMSKTMAATAVSVLLDESFHPIFRSLIYPQYATMLSLGIFAMMGLATLMSWRTSSLLAAGLSVLAYMSVFLVSETPAWLVRKGHLLKAQQALHRLWSKEKAKETFEDLKKRYCVEERTSNSYCQITPCCKTLLNPRYLKPFLIIHIINVIIQLLCGNHLVLNYSVDMVSRMTDHHDPYIVNAIFSLLRTLVCFIGGITVSVVGRRISMLFSGIGTAISATALAGVLFADLNLFMTAEVRQIVSIVLLGAFVVLYSSGYYTIPSLMIGETQPAVVRGYLCGYIFTMNDFIAGGVVKTYPWLLRILGLHGMFLMFGMSCAICALFCYLFLPETNRKSLEEIEDYFKQKNIMWITRDKSSMKRCDNIPEAHRLYEEDASSRRLNRPLNSGVQ